LQTALGNVNTSTLQTSITALQTSLTALQTQLTADEAKIAADQTNITTLQNQANLSNIKFNTLSDIAPASGTSTSLALTITNNGGTSQSVPVILTIWTPLISGVSATLNGVAGTVSTSSVGTLATTRIIFNLTSISVGANSIYSAIASPVLVITLPTGTTTPTWSAQWSY
jgi:Tfp pilus assembly protein PilN